MLPNIPVPQKYDLLNEAMIAEDIKKARDGKFDTVIIDELEIDYVSKKFYNMPEVRDKIKLIKMIDPFNALTVDEKIALEASRVINKVDFVLSVYLKSFVDEAIEENEDFVRLTLDEQKAILMVKAEAKAKTMSVMGAIIPDINA